VNKLGKQFFSLSLVVSCVGSACGMNDTQLSWRDRMERFRPQPVVAVQEAFADWQSQYLSSADEEMAVFMRELGPATPTPLVFAARPDWDNDWREAQERSRAQTPVVVKRCAQCHKAMHQVGDEKNYAAVQSAGQGICFGCYQLKKVEGNGRQVMPEDAQCSVCLDRGMDMMSPVLLTCTHAYCFGCLYGWLRSATHKTCPNCRALIFCEGKTPTT